MNAGGGDLPERTGSEWLIASNHRLYNADEAFATLSEVDWSETLTAHIHPGDVLYLYATSPESKLTHACIVTRTGIPYAEMLDDRLYWIDEAALAERETRSWMRLRLIATFTETQRAALSLDELKKVGLRGAPQGRMRVPAGVSERIHEVVTLTTSEAATRKSRGQARVIDAKKRIAIERYAVRRAIAYYLAHGATAEDIDDTGAYESYDLRVRIGGETRHVEVKGSSIAKISQVDLTKNEVEHAHGSPTDLIVVDGIDMWQDEQGLYQTSGGRFRVWADWVPSPESLTPTRFSHWLH